MQKHLSGGVSPPLTKGEMTMLRVLRLIFASLLVACVATGAAVAAGPNLGNSLNAKSCQKDGWKTLVRADASSFTSPGDCVSYGAQGGTLYQGVTISGYVYGADAESTLLGVTGTGFTSTHTVTFTATGLGSNSLPMSDGTVSTDGTGAFDSAANQVANFWFVDLACADAPMTVHLTATDGVHLGVTDVSFTGCAT